MKRAAIKCPAVVGLLRNIAIRAAGNEQEYEITRSMIDGDSDGDMTDVASFQAGFNNG